MPHKIRDTNIRPAVRSLGVEITSLFANENGEGGTRDTDIDVYCEVPNMLQNKAHFSDTLNARRVGAIISGGTISFMFDSQNIGRDMDIVL